MEMKSRPVISVVMPAYNAERYIAEAIESVIAQSFTNWELVIVDDCSSDHTLKIAQKYEEQDERIQVLHLHKNTGSAYLPRKKAIETTQADWVVSLDADDYLAHDDLARLYERQIETQADIVLHQLVKVSIDNEVISGFECPSLGFDFGMILSGKAACGLTIGSWTINGNGLFRKVLYQKIWRESKDDNVGMNGDELLTRLLFLQADKVAFCTAKYFYRLNPLSITQKLSIKQFDVLYTNADLKRLISNFFAADSEEVKRMAMQQCKGLISCSLLLYNKNLYIPLDLKIKLKQRVYEEWKNIDWKVVTPQLKYRPFSYLLALNYNLYKAILKCWSYVGSIKQKL